MFDMLQILSNLGLKDSSSTTMRLRLLLSEIARHPKFEHKVKEVAQDLSLGAAGVSQAGITSNTTSTGPTPRTPGRVATVPVHEGKAPRPSIPHDGTASTRSSAGGAQGVSHSDSKHTDTHDGGDEQHDSQVGDNQASEQETTEDENNEAG